VVEFLTGKQGELESELERQMREAAADLDFEAAARHRNRLDAVRAIRERQKVVSSRPLNMDVIGFFREETIAGAHVFVVREGRVLYGNEFVLDKADVSMRNSSPASFSLLRIVRSRAKSWCPNSQTLRCWR
jgi:excinuclease ABC subunit C